MSGVTGCASLGTFMTGPPSVVCGALGIFEHPALTTLLVRSPKKPVPFARPAGTSSSAFFISWYRATAAAVSGPYVVLSSPGEPAPAVAIRVAGSALRNCCSCLTSSPVAPRLRLRANAAEHQGPAVVFVVMGSSVCCAVTCRACSAFSAGITSSAIKSSTNSLNETACARVAPSHTRPRRALRLKRPRVLQKRYGNVLVCSPWCRRRYRVM